MSGLLEVKNLKVEFELDSKTIAAVNGVDLSVNQNEVVVLAGESGSGKTVTAMALTRILAPNARIREGEIIFNGLDLLKIKEPDLIKVRGRQIAYIFQEPTSYLNPVYTIGEQISEAIILHQDKSPKDAFKEAALLLESVRIKEPERALASYPHQLSGGMNQRVFIAMSLACKPKLLIADEPTTSLDVTIEAEILKLMADLRLKFGFSLLFITHNLSIARKIADRIYVMYKGKVVEEGTVQSIFASPRHFHTKELIAAYEKIGKL